MSLTLDVVVVPGSRSPGLGYSQRWNCVEVRVRSQARKGRANREVERLLSEVLGAEVRIVSGHTSRRKRVVVEGDPDAVKSLLEGILHEG